MLVSNSFVGFALWSSSTGTFYGHSFGAVKCFVEAGFTASSCALGPNGIPVSTSGRTQLSFVDHTVFQWYTSSFDTTVTVSSRVQLWPECLLLCLPGLTGSLLVGPGPVHGPNGP